MEQKGLMIFEEDEEITYEDDFYREDYLEEMVDDDSITGNEYGFMLGYLSEEELEE